MNFFLIKYRNFFFRPESYNKVFHFDEEKDLNLFLDGFESTEKEQLVRDFVKSLKDIDYDFNLGK